jgi:hypothetical protein
MTQKYVASSIAALVFGTLAACSPSDQSAEAAVIDTSAIVTNTRVVNPGQQFSIATTQIISSRIASAGDTFTGTVVTEVRDHAGRVAIPQGSLVSGMITEVTSAPNVRSSGTLTLVVNSVTVRGKSYRLEARVDSVIPKAADRDIRFPAGTRVILTLTQRLTL